MNIKYFSFLPGLPLVIGIVALVPALAADWTPSLTPDGQPDVQGFWLTTDYGMGCLSDPRNGNVGCVRESGAPRRTNGAAEAAGGRGGGRGNRGGGGEGQARAKSPSRIIDTPDGEIPYQPWARERQKFLLENYFEPTKPEFIDPQQRCWPLGAVRQFTWHDVGIIQYPGYVLLSHEGGHSYQIIPLDGRPHVGENIKLWMGDSRGHWEGTTLVVDVTNNNAKGRLSRAGDFSSDKVHHVVRMKFIDKDTMRYEATFEDPSVYTRPWTFGFDMKRALFGENDPKGVGQKDYEQWEEACVEGLRDVDTALRPAGAGNDVSEKK
jgi:hypothetical protein